MAQENTQAPAAPKPEDLSARIILAVERKPGDQVRCSRVFGTRYRCNWWAIQSAHDAPAASCGQLSTTHTIRMSQFLDVTTSPLGLQIKVISSSEG